MDEQHRFFVFLLENYACAKNRRTSEVLLEWDERGITQEVFNCWFIYHQEALTNAFDDIDSLLATGKHIYP